MESLRFGARSEVSGKNLDDVGNPGPSRRPRRSSRDPFWRNRRSFAIVVVLALISGTLLAASVSAAPAGETAFWPLDDGSGLVAADSSANAFDGTITGATWTTGISGPALDFTGGANERVVVNEPSNELDLGPDQDISISLWFKTTASPSATHEWSLVRRLNEATGDGYLITLRGNTPQLRFIHEDAGNTRETRYSTALNDGEWHHVVGVINNGTMELYIDGVLVDSVTGTASSSSFAEPFVIGGSVTGDIEYDYEGVIDEVVVYDRFLLSAEIAELYDDPFGLRVNSTGNTVDAVVGDGICDTGSFNTEGAPECTLHAAIQESNFQVTSDRITFNIPPSDLGNTSGIWTIRPTVDLPVITGTVVLDGSTQPGYVSSPIIELDGSLVSGSVLAGLFIQSDDSEFRGLAIYGWPDENLELNGATGRAQRNTVAGMYLGVDASGAAQTNGNALIRLLSGARDNIIGGGLEIDRNVLGSGPGTGIDITGPTTQRNTIARTNIGVLADGTTARPNTNHGISIRDGASDNVIGGALGANIITNNPGDGVSVFADAGSGNAILNNSIWNNGERAIDIGPTGQTPNDPGDADTGANDLLNHPTLVDALNNGDGTLTVRYTLDNPDGDYLVDFFRNDGLDSDGYGELQTFSGRSTVSGYTNGPTEYSQLILGSSGDLLTAVVTEGTPGAPGSTSESSLGIAAEQTFLVNSTDEATDSTPGDGLCDTGNTNSEGATECTLHAAITEANFASDADKIYFDIPLSDGGYSDPTWIFAPGSQMPAITTPIIIDATTQPTFAGQPVIQIDGSGMPGGSNGLSVDAGSDATQIRGFSITSAPQAGIEISGANTIVAGNWIGLRASDGKAEGNLRGIVVTSGATGTVIGGTTIADRNVIGGQKTSGSAGIHVEGAGTSTTSIDGNWIGIEPDGSTKGENWNGIEVSLGATTTDIGVNAGNVISGNDSFGVVIEDAGTDTVRIQNSLIGVAADGVTAVANLNDGIRVQAGATNVQIGASGSGNVIAANADDGIDAFNSGAGLSIVGNTIGTDLSASETGIGNAELGIKVLGSSSAPVEIRLNTIAYNGLTGITVSADYAGPVRIEQNELFQNAELAIDLGHDGITNPNDPGDGDAGPNDMLNHPVVTATTPDGAETYAVDYDIDVPPGSYVVHFFSNNVADPSGFGEAQTWLGSQAITATSGVDSFSKAALTATAGTFITAQTIASSNGASSEMGNAIAVAASATLTVNSTGNLPDLATADGTCDTGGTNIEGATECTLAAAIAQANATAGSNFIRFDIPSLDPGEDAGVWTISPTTGVPAISELVELDATSQPGWSGSPVIEIDGSASTDNDGLKVDPLGAGSEIQGFSMIGYAGDGISSQADDVTISDNYVGVRPDGLTAAPNLHGITIWNGANRNSVRDNLISGNLGNGIQVVNAGTIDTEIDGNLIGTDATGNAAIPNGIDGLRIDQSSGTLIGVTTPNVISGNTGRGIQVLNAASTQIANNLIGVAANGTTPVGNGTTGVEVGGALSSNVTIGATGAGNVISSNTNGVTILNPGTGVVVRDNFIGTDAAASLSLGNTGNGMRVQTSNLVIITENVITDSDEEAVVVPNGSSGVVSILRNSIYANGTTAIDLGDNNTTDPNDPGDVDSGANGLLNHPELLSSVETSPGVFTLNYELDVPAGSYEIDFYQNDAADPSGFGEAQTFVGSHLVSATAGVDSLSIGGLTFASGTIATAQTYSLVDGATSEIGNALAPQSTITVNSTGNSPDSSTADGVCNTGFTNSEGATECTLDAAIKQANAIAGLTNIAFNIPPSDPNHSFGIWTITPAVKLPGVTEATYLDASTQPGFTGTPVVVIDGSTLTGGTDILELTTGSDGSTIRGFTLVGGPDDAIWSRANNNTIVGNYVGTRPGGALPGDGNLDGIVAWDGAIGTVIGGTAAADRNIIAGNTANGIKVRDLGTSGTAIDGNWIGLEDDGTTVNGNLTGIRFSGDASNTTVGANEPNIIAGGQTGVAIVAVGAGIQIQDNYIGTDATGLADFGQALDAVVVSTMTNNVLISQNTIAFSGDNGIVVDSATTGAIELDRNLIYNNAGLAIDLGDDDVTTNDAGDADTGPNGLLNHPAIASVNNTSPGFHNITFSIDVPAGAHTVHFYANNTADPSGFGEAQTLIGSMPIIATSSVDLFVSPSFPVSATAFVSALTVASDGSTSEMGNALASALPSSPLVNSTRDLADSNVGDGVCSTGAQNSETNPECTLRAAIEEANASVGITAINFDIPTSEGGHSSGIWTISPLSELPFITETVALDASTQPGFVGNPVVQLDGSGFTGSDSGIKLVTDNSVVRGFIVHSFDDEGIEVDGISGFGVGNTIAGNWVGIDASGAVAPNAGHGILLAATAMSNVVGGAGPLDANVVGGNAVAGIGIRLTSSANNRIEGNYIGVRPDGVTPIPNAGPGIRITETSENNIVLGNTIRFNATTGIELTADAGEGNTFLSNSLLSNTGIGIDLGSDGVTSNDPGDVDTGPNGHLNFPEITSAVWAAGTFTVDFDLDVPAGDYRIEFFSNSSTDVTGFGEGQTLESATTITHTGSGSESFSHSYADAATVPRLSMTATIQTGPSSYSSTSEFSAWVSPSHAPVVVDPGNQTDSEGDVVSLPIAGSDPDLDTLTWSANNLPDGLTINTTTGEISGTLTNTSAGLWAVSVTATDPDTLSDTVDFIWDVTNTNQPPVLDPIGDSTINEQTPLTFTATATDPDLDTLTYTLTGQPPGANITTTGDFTWTPTEAQGPGTYTFDVTVTDNGTPNLTDTETITITVDDINQTPAITNPGNQTDAEADVINLVLAGTDPDGDTLTWTATGLPDGLTINTTTGEISGTLSYTSAGTHAVTVTATDPGTLSDTTNFTWNVTNTNRTIVLAIPSRTDSEGDTIDFPQSGADPDGDTLTWSATNLPPGLTINSATGRVTGTISYNSDPNYLATITAFDGTNSSSGSFNWGVTDVNRAPIAASPGDQADTETNVISLPLSGSDPDGDTLTWTATSLPDGLTINTTTGEISGTLSYTSAGTHAVTVTATDDGTPNLDDTINFTWDVTNTNQAPVLTNPGNQTDAEADVISLAITGVDPDGDTLTWAATGLPPALTINTTTGEISGTLSDTSAGTWAVSVTATDDGTPNLDNTINFTWNVTNTNQTPVVVSPGNQTDAETDVISLVLSGTDPDGDTLTWTATGLPPALAINTTTGEITGTLTTTSAGSYPISITATDDGTPNLDDTINFTWNVTNTNQAPVVVNPGNQTDAETDIISLPIAGSDPDLDTLTWSAINLPDGLTINASTGEISGTLTNTSAGLWAVSVTATDPDTLSDTVNFIWDVTNTNQPPVLDPIGDSTINEQTLFAITATASDPDLDTLTYTLTGQPPGAAITTGGDFTWTPTEAQGPGTYTFDVTVTDNGTPNLTDTETITITVDDINQAPAITNPGDQTDAEADVINLVLAGTDPDGDSLTWTATGLPDGLTINTTTGEISGTLSYTSAGSYPISVTAIDDGTPNLDDTINFTWNVTNTNRAPVLTNPGFIAHTEQDSVNEVVSHTDADGDTVTWTATGLPTGVSIDSITGAMTGTPTFNSAGAYTPTVTADDGFPGGQASVTFDWVIYNLNRDPVISGLTNQTTVSGSTANVSPSATDPDGDTLFWSATGLPDGLAIDSGNGVISGTVTTPGTSTVSVTAADGFGGSDVETITWTVSPPPATTTTTTTTTAPPTTTTAPPITTTTAPTTTAPTTTAPTTTAPTTTAPTTTSPSTTVANTVGPTTTVTSTTTSSVDDSTPSTSNESSTSTTSSAPTALPFAQVNAVDDRIAASTDLTFIPVFDNDSFGANPIISSVTQPAVGSVEIVDSGVLVTVPASLAGELTFTYTLTDDSGTTSTAEVIVFSVNVLAPAGELVAPQQDLRDLSDVLGRVTTLFTGLLSIRLTTIQLTVLALGPLVFAGLLLIVRRREDLLAVTNTPRTRSVDVDINDRSFKLRHDAYVWSERKSRTTADGRVQARVELPNGDHSWIDKNLLTDTGF